MTEVARILDQLRRAWDGDAWHGPPVRRVLEGVSALQACVRTANVTHNIAEIVLHLIAWHETTCRRLEGRVYEPSPGENWPEVSHLTEVSWAGVIAELGISFEELCFQVGRLSDGRLEEQVPGKKYSVYVLLHGVVQHDLYHAGQIALLKKLAAG